MNAADRLKRIAEIENVANQLVEKGWNVEKIMHIDEDGEPFTSVLTMTVEDSSPWLNRRQII